MYTNTGRDSFCNFVSFPLPRCGQFDEIIRNPLGVKVCLCNWQQFFVEQVAGSNVAEEEMRYRSSAILGSRAGAFSSLLWARVKDKLFVWFSDYQTRGVKTGGRVHSSNVCSAFYAQCSGHQKDEKTVASPYMINLTTKCQNVWQSSCKRKKGRPCSRLSGRRC